MTVSTDHANWDIIGTGKSGQNGPILWVFRLHRISKKGFLWKPRDTGSGFILVKSQNTLELAVATGKYWKSLLAAEARL